MSEEKPTGRMRWMRVQHEEGGLYKVTMIVDGAEIRSHPTYKLQMEVSAVGEFRNRETGEVVAVRPVLKWIDVPLVDEFGDGLQPHMNVARWS